MLNLNRIDKTVHLSFKDILLVPYDDDFCTVKSRSDPDISTEVCPGKKINIPLISSPMDSITERAMAIAMNKTGGLGVHTRYINDKDDLKKKLSAIRALNDRSDCPYPACAVGVVPERGVYEHVRQLCEAGLKIVCLDIANGNHIFMRDALKAVDKLKQQFGLSVMAGNVASGKAAKRLYEHGADAIRVGIGSGAICTTRRIVGFGIPQLTAIMDVRETFNPLVDKVSIIADGGIRNSGDVCKALWAGADAVMSGFIFAGHDECPKFVGMSMYRGMSSRTVSQRSDVAPEGVCFEVKRKGPVEPTIRDYAAAIRASLSMANAMTLDAFRKKVKAIRVSTVSNEESDPVRSE